jgi:hypothetical protein
LIGNGEVAVDGIEDCRQKPDREGERECFCDKELQFNLIQKKLMLRQARGRGADNLFRQSKIEICLGYGSVLKKSNPRRLALNLSSNRRLDVCPARFDEAPRYLSSFGDCLRVSPWFNRRSRDVLGNLGLKDVESDCGKMARKGDLDWGE